MTALLILIFIIAYAAIALEEPLKINKSASALIGAGLLWTVYAMLGHGGEINGELARSLADTAQIAFFLMGAMTIVEVIDIHGGFDAITTRIKARSLSGFIWLIGGVTFFLSAILDNLTTAIVMVSLIRKLVGEKDVRLYMAGIIIIAANAGGAWSPLGDVTTTMLWIGGQVTAGAIVSGLILPSIANMVVPLALVSWSFRGRPLVTAASGREGGPPEGKGRGNLIFPLGLAVLLLVPVFKTVTHLPPWLGMLFGLGILWAVADLVHRGEDREVRQRMTIASALTRIDMGAIIFFVGILLAVAVLEHTHVLEALTIWLNATFGRIDVIVLLFGLVSAVVDNVPIVAAAMGMFPLGSYPADNFLWEFLAYCAGTGGSILIIGSAAGVAVMSIEKIGFIWYLRKFSLLALLGYLAGALVYVVQNSIFS